MTSQAMGSLGEWANRALNVPTGEQVSSGYCGPASLLIAFRALGMPEGRPEPTEQDIGEQAGTDEALGTTLAGMEQAARFYGYDATAKTGATFEQLANALASGAVPIVAWFSDTDGHYSPVQEVTPTDITLSDPETAAPNRFTLQDFLAIWQDFDGPAQSNPIRSAVLYVRAKPPAQPIATPEPEPTTQTPT